MSNVTEQPPRLGSRGRIPRRPIDRLVDKVKVDDETGCWEWQGYVTPNGYGAMVLGSRVDNSVRREFTHRVAWTELVGPIPDGLHIDHLCRNTICCNPGHLEPVTPRINALRSESPAALNARKAACVEGHPFDAENTYVNPTTGGRRCRTCQRDYERETWHLRPRPVDKAPRSFQVDNAVWFRAQEKAVAEGTTLPQVLRAFLAQYVD